MVVQVMGDGGGCPRAEPAVIILLSTAKELVVDQDFETDPDQDQAAEGLESVLEEVSECLADLCADK